ncbi:sensor histidine kinase [Gallibacter sp. Marseille-QA0791]|uniref:sensor histidine kinase n=1 Tax=Gallibacter sp. Marseille-QA0791 TaxID=3378781 RepID=UPI003D145EEE
MKKKFSQYLFLGVIIVLIGIIFIYALQDRDGDIRSGETGRLEMTEAEREHVENHDEVVIYVDDSIRFMNADGNGFLQEYMDDVFRNVDLDIRLTDEEEGADGRITAVTDEDRNVDSNYVPPLLQLDWAMYVKADGQLNSDLSGVIVEGYQRSEDNDISYDGQDVDFVYADSAEEALELARAEDLDFMLAPRSAMWLALDGNKDYLATEDSVYSQNVCIMVDEDSVLYTLMNKCINVTDRHTLSYEASQKWFDGNGPVYMKENNEDVYMLVLIIFTSVMIAFFIYYQTNKNLYAELENRMEKLNESKKELKTTFNGVSYYLAELDLNGVVLDINRYFFEAIHKNVTNSNIYDILEMDEEGRASLREMMERASRGEYTESREITRKQDIFEVDIFPIEGAKGVVEKLLFMARDITGEVMAERQMLQDNKMIAVGQLAAGVAHEIRNPLGIIRNYCYVLKNMDVDMEIRDKAIGHIEAAVDRSGAIINNLLNFSRASSGQEEWIDVEEHIRSLASLNDNILRKKNIKLEITCSEKIETYIRVEALDMILINLVQNATDAMKENGKLSIKVVKYKQEFEIDVQDTGTGIEEDILQNIFNPFFTTKEGHKGNGLGLYIVYNETGKLDGKIDVRSKVGVGSVFMLTLPLREHRSGEVDDGKKEHEHTGGR